MDAEEKKDRPPDALDVQFLVGEDNVIAVSVDTLEALIRHLFHIAKHELKKDDAGIGKFVLGGLLETCKAGKKHQKELFIRELAKRAPGDFGSREKANEILRMIAEEGAKKAHSINENDVPDKDRKEESHGPDQS